MAITGISSILGTLTRRLMPWRKRLGSQRSRAVLRRLRASTRGPARDVESADRRVAVRRRRANASAQDADVEAPRSLRRACVSEAEHGMAPDNEEVDNAEGGGDEDRDHLLTEEDDSRGFSTKDLMDAWEERQKTLTEKERLDEQQEQTEAIHKICKARSASYMFDLMDQLIKDEWLGGVDALPGDIYTVLSLSMGKKKMDVTSMGRLFGFIFIFLIQLCGPPLIFFQFYTGAGVEDKDKVDWKGFKPGDVSDWFSAEGSYSRFCYTKFIAFLFVTVFVLNGMFVQFDEKKSWLKIDKIFRVLNYNGYMHGTSEWILKVGAFMNMWVIIWLCLDVFISLGMSDTVQDVLMDALGLTFIFNLDDIGGDLGFIDDDDWPGLELAWVSDHVHEVAEELSDIDEVEASSSCAFFLDLATYILVAFVLIMPVLFIVTPFQKMKPELFFEELSTQAKLNQLVEEKVRSFVMNASVAHA